MPYFRKASVLAEIGWQIDQLKPKDCIFSEAKTFVSQSNKSDTKIVPLFLTHLTKPSQSSSTSSLNSSPSENQFSDKILEIHSPNRQNVCTLKFEDSAQCTAWFNAIYSIILNLSSNALNEINKAILDNLEGAELKHMGWLYEKV